MKIFVSTRILALLVLFGLFSSLNAQNSSIAIHSLRGFPDVISTGNSYNVEAYIVNTGSVSFSGNSSVWVSFNGGSPEKITGGWSPAATLAPGDSLLWQRNGYTFTNSAIVTGLNDILVWPESPHATTSDSISKYIIQGSGAAFRVNNQSIAGAPLKELLVHQFYDLQIVATNAGDKANADAVVFWAQLDSDAPIFLGESTTLVAIGEDCALDLPGFSLKALLDQGWSHPYFPSEVRFFAQETTAMPPLDSASYDVKLTTGLNPNLSSVSFDVFPVPVQNYLKLNGNVAPRDVAQVSIIDIDGKICKSWSSMPEVIDMTAFAAGTYMVKLDLRSGQSETRKFLKF